MARPSKVLISRDAAARAALAIIDAEGLDALSLERLAREIGVKAPSLYHHFADKAEILARVARLVVLETPVPPEPTPDNWQEWMVEMCLGFRRAILAHPNAAPLLLRYFPRHFMLSSYERASRVLHQVGVPLELHVLIIEGVDKLTLGSGLYGATRRAAGEPEFPTVDPDRDPMLARALEANAWDEEAAFAETVRSFLRGVMKATPVKVGRRRTGSRASKLPKEATG
jgi:TetR/AcrR family tetracycline transcriptional repressor